ESIRAANTRIAYEPKPQQRPPLPPPLENGGELIISPLSKGGHRGVNAEDAGASHALSALEIPAPEAAGTLQFDPGNLHGLLLGRQVEPDDAERSLLGNGHAQGLPVAGLDRVRHRLRTPVLAISRRPEPLDLRRAGELTAQAERHQRRAPGPRSDPEERLD